MKIGNVILPDIPLILAPMEDVTEMPFRLICKRFGADLVFSEFVASEALVRNVEKSIRKMRLVEEERPVGIQIFGHDVDSLVVAASKALEANPDILDLNCGCPVKKVVSKGAGAAMLKDPDKMVRAAAEIVKISNKPVTVKTRIGWDANSIVVGDVALRLQDVGVSALSIHGRTRSQMYTGLADWRVIADVKANPAITIPVFGNGDITSGETAKERLDMSGVDGLMIGRAAIGNPWIFRDIRHYLQTGDVMAPPTIKERVDVCREHFYMSVEYKGEKRTLLEMRHHYVKYFKGIVGFKPYKMKLMTAMSSQEVLEILDMLEREKNEKL
ncbi:MAG: tRNA dihydrouridine synthase DusB [Bacteroidales bacterium]|nr:tRNA dihydrouridine synthase DusB [Bacteroidales bacterium]